MRVRRCYGTTTITGIAIASIESLWSRPLSFDSLRQKHRNSDAQHHGQCGRSRRCGSRRPASSLGPVVSVEPLRLFELGTGLFPMFSTAAVDVVINSSNSLMIFGDRSRSVNQAGPSCTPVRLHPVSHPARSGTRRIVS